MHVLGSHFGIAPGVTIGTTKYNDSKYTKSKNVTILNVVNLIQLIRASSLSDL